MTSARRDRYQLGRWTRPLLAGADALPVRALPRRPDPSRGDHLMSVIRVGSNAKYSEGWASVFGKGGGAKKKVAKKAAAKAKAAGGKKAGRKAGAKKK